MEDYLVEKQSGKLSESNATNQCTLVRLVRADLKWRSMYLENIPFCGSNYFKDKF